MYLYGHGGGKGMYVWRMPKLVGEEAYVCLKPTLLIADLDRRTVPMTFDPRLTYTVQYVYPCINSLQEGIMSL